MVVYERNSFTSYYCQFLFVNSVSVKTETIMTETGQKQKFVIVKISVYETVILGYCNRNLTEKERRILEFLLETAISAHNSNRFLFL